MVDPPSEGARAGCHDFGDPGARQGRAGAPRTGRSAAAPPRSSRRSSRSTCGRGPRPTARTRPRARHATCSSVSRRSTNVSESRPVDVICGKGVERAAWLERRRPRAFRPSTSMRRRRSYSATIRWTSALAARQRLERRVLGRRGSRHDPVLVDLDDALEDPGRRAQEADPPAGHGVGLGEAAHQDRPLAHARQGAQRAMAVVAVGEAVVDLVADRRADRGGRRSARSRPGPRPGARPPSGCTGSRGTAPWSGRDRRLDVGGVEREVVLEPASRRDGTEPPENVTAGDVRHVRGLVEDDLVAGSHVATQRQVDRLGGADGDEDLGRRVVPHAVAPLDVRPRARAAAPRPVVGGVVRPARAEALDARLDDLRRRVEVGLADAQADDVVHRRGDVEEAPDARRRDLSDATREGSLGERRTCLDGRGCRVREGQFSGPGVGGHGAKAYDIGPRQTVRTVDRVHRVPVTRGKRSPALPGSR